MRIGLISREYPWRQPCGGVGVSTANMARSLAQAGQDVTVITQSPDGTPRDAREGDVRVLGLPLPRRHLLPRRLSTFSVVETRTWSQLAASTVVNAEEPFDIVEAPLMGGEALSLLKRASHPPVVVRIRGGASLHMSILGRHRWYHYPLYARERRSMILADRLCSLSSQAWNTIKGYYRVSLPQPCVIPNCVDMDVFHPAPAGERTEGPATVLFVGKLNAVKGFDLMPAIVARVLQAEPAVQFCFAGADPAAGTLDSAPAFFARSRPPVPGDRIQFLGAVPLADMPRLYRSADVLVAPSRIDALPRACTEAGACGLPVVGARGTGIESIVQDGLTGYLEPVEKPERFANRLLKLIRDVPLRRTMGAAAREVVARTFSDKAVADATLTLYRETIETVAERKANG